MLSGFKQRGKKYTSLGETVRAIVLKTHYPLLKQARTNARTKRMVGHRFQNKTYDCSLLSKPQVVHGHAA